MSGKLTPASGSPTCYYIVDIIILELVFAEVNNQSESWQTNGLTNKKQTNSQIKSIMNVDLLL